MIRIIAFLIGASVKCMLAPSFLISALLLVAAVGIVEEAGAWRSYALGEIPQGNTARLTLILSAEHDSSEGARLDAERICGNANIENCTTDSSAMNFETTGGDPAPNPFQNACVGAAYAPLSVSVYIRMTLWDGFQRRGSITDESAFQAAMAACNAALAGNGTCGGQNPPERLCDLSGCSADTHVVDHSEPGGCREGRPSDCPRMGDAADQTLLHINNGRAMCLNESECADRFRAPRGFRCVVPESPHDCMALDAASPAPGIGPVFNPEADGSGRCIVEAACEEEFRLVENSQCVEPRIHQDCADAGRLFFVDETGFHGEIGASLCLNEAACTGQNRVARDGRCVLPASPEECMALYAASSLDADIGPVFNDLGICITEAACTERFRLVKDGRCVAPENPQDCMALDEDSSDEGVGPVFNPGASGAMRCIVEAACTEQLRLVKDRRCVAPETPQDCMALDATYTGTRDRFGPVFFADGGACIAENFCINQLLRVAKEGLCVEPETPQDCVALDAGYTGGRTNIGPFFDADGGSGERCRTEAACLSKGRAVKDGRCVAPESSEDCLLHTLYAPGSSPGEGRCVIGGVCTLLHRVPKEGECVVPESAQDCMALDAVSFDPLIGPVFDADGSGAMRCLADEAACTEQFRLVQEGQCVAPASYQDCVNLDAAFGASEAGLSIGPIFHGNRSGAARCSNPVSFRECRELSLNSDQLTPIFERGACRAQAGDECPYPDQPLHVFYAPSLAPQLCHTENECWSRGYLPDASAETCRAAATHADCLRVSERGASLMHAVYHDPDHMLLCRRPQTNEECREASEMLGLMTPLLMQFPPGDTPPDQPSCMALSSDSSEADMQCAAAFGSAGDPYSAAGGRCVQGCPADDKYQAGGMAACLTAQECYDSFLVPRSDGSCTAVATNADCGAVLVNHGSPPSGLGAIYDDDEALDCRHPKNSKECVIYRLTEPIYDHSEDDNCAPAESSNECQDTHPDLPLRVADGSCRASNADDECRNASPQTPISDGAGGCAPAVDDAACRVAHSTFPISGGDGSCGPAADNAACRAAHPEFPIRGGDGSCEPPTSHADCLVADSTLPIFDGVLCIVAADDAVCRAAHPDLPISDGRGLCRAVASHADCRFVDPALPIFDGGTCRAAEDGECSLHHPSAPNALLEDDGSILCLSLEECAAMTLVPDGSICDVPESSFQCSQIDITRPIFVEGASGAGRCATAQTDQECADAFPFKPVRNADGSCRAESESDACRSADPLAPILNEGGSCEAAADNDACRAAFPTFPIRGTDGSCGPAEDHAACQSAHPARAAETAFPIRGADGSCGPAEDHAACQAAHPAFPIRGADGSCNVARSDAECAVAHSDEPVEFNGMCVAPAECTEPTPFALPDDPTACASEGQCRAMARVMDGSACRPPESSFECATIDARRPVLERAASGVAQCVAAESDAQCRTLYPDRQKLDDDGSCRPITSTECRNENPASPISILTGSGRSCAAAENHAACRAAHPAFPIRAADGSCEPAEDHAACQAAYPAFPIRAANGLCRAAAGNADCAAAYPAEPLERNGMCVAAGTCAAPTPLSLPDNPPACVSEAECMAMTRLASAAGACVQPQNSHECRRIDRNRPILDAAASGAGRCVAATSGADCMNNYPNAPRFVADGSCRPLTNEECRETDATAPISSSSGCMPAADSEACFDAHSAFPIRGSDGSCREAASDAECMSEHPGRPFQFAGTCVEAICEDPTPLLLQGEETCVSEAQCEQIGRLSDLGACRIIANDEDCAMFDEQRPVFDASDGSCRSLTNEECRAADPTAPISSSEGCVPAADSEACFDAYSTLPIRGSDGSCREAASDAECMSEHPDRPFESNGTCVEAICADPTPLLLQGEETCVSEAQCERMGRLSDLGACRIIANDEDCAMLDEQRPVFDESDGSCRSLTDEECRAADPTAPISSSEGCVPAADSEACFDAYSTLPIRDSDGSCREAASDAECMSEHPDRPFEFGGACVEAICEDPTPLLLQGEETCVSEAQCEQMGRLSGLGACRTIANDQDCAMLDEQRPVFDESNSSCRPLTNEECLEADSTAPISAGGGCIPAADSDACLAAHPRRPIRADDGSCNPAANSMECMDAFGDRLPIRQRDSACAPRSQADCSPRILGDDGICRDAENAGDCRAAGLSETAVHDGMCVAFSHEFCRSTGQVAELQADGTINCRNPSNVQECMDYLNLGAIDNGVCGSAGREYCAAQGMFFAGDSCVDNCPAGEIGIDGACAQAAAEGELLYETMQCEEAGWEAREEFQITVSMTLLAAFCNIPARITMASLEASAQAAGEVRDGALNSCVLWHNTGYIATDPLCGNERLFGEEGLPRRPAGFEAREGHRLTVLLATATGEGQSQITFNNAAVGRLSSSSPSGGDASSSGGESGGGAIFALVPLALAAYYWAVSDDSSLIPEFGYRQENGEDIWKYGGRIEYRGEGWRSYVAADAEGESGRMTYKSGGRYEGSFWSASYSSRETGLAGDYDFALSAEWDAGVWRMTPGWRMKFSHEAGDLWESSGMLSMDALWNANKWTARPQAGFAWNFDAGGFVPRLQMDVRREF